jgi:hypothetical protein
MMESWTLLQKPLHESDLSHVPYFKYLLNLLHEFHLQEKHSVRIELGRERVAWDGPFKYRPAKQR